MAAVAADGKGKQEAAEGMDVRKDGVAREVIRMDREAVIPILKPKLFMHLTYLIGLLPPLAPPNFPLLAFCCGSLAVAYTTIVYQYMYCLCLGWALSITASVGQFDGSWVTAQGEGGGTHASQSIIARNREILSSRNCSLASPLRCCKEAFCCPTGISWK
jgi:hypothetical protein